jgi:hypothetical protein
VKEIVRLVMFFVVRDVENDKRSALMALVFSQEKWLVSYMICVTTVDENNKTCMSSSGRYSDSSTHKTVWYLGQAIRKKAIALGLTTLNLYLK